MSEANLLSRFLNSLPIFGHGTKRIFNLVCLGSLGRGHPPPPTQSKNSKEKQGSLKDTFCPFENMAFSTKIKGTHHLQGNVQVYNVRIKGTQLPRLPPSPPPPPHPNPPKPPLHFTASKVREAEVPGAAQGDGQDSLDRLGLGAWFGLEGSGPLGWFKGGTGRNHPLFVAGVPWFETNRPHFLGPGLKQNPPEPLAPFFDVCFLAQVHRAIGWTPWIKF